ncbi:MAG: tetratricopeptide repeat protein [Candidatus Omnitrophica bacterium]|nr:tetratricopeptide repeat protein [Candidatus Omnitrophota bacterium]
MSNFRPTTLIIAAVVLIALILLAIGVSSYQKTSYEVDPSQISYVGSQSCKECHEEIFREWGASVHALAERPIDEEREAPAFLPPKEIQVVDSTSKAFEKDGEFLIHTLGKDGKKKDFEPARILGDNPLRQFLVPQDRGYVQVTSLAFDPQAEEWFDVFGDENRQPHEWGFWANKGMTWNTMCAECHNTRVNKNYDIQKDVYHTDVEEMGVGCEACHGPGEAHVEWHRSFHILGDDPVKRLEGKELIDSCGRCHARRTALTEDFYPGDLFLDHYVPELPNDTEVYYPDGQVHDEDYVYSSFRMSRMYHEGVTCLDCHLPHTGKTKFEGNTLCLQCHADKINPTEHSHHKVDQPGGFCVNCHMPTTVYMQRQPRRDHGFTIPDPKLTIEADVPNACNRCHDDKSPEWALEATEKWWGPVDERVNGKRSRAVLAVRNNAPDALPRLLEVARNDPLTTWKAIAVGLLKSFMGSPQAVQVATSLLDHPDPLVRTMAVDSFEHLGGSYPAQLQAKLTDPVRSVRIRAAWLLHQQLEDSHPAFRELLDYLRLSADQPVGALQLATVYRQRDRGNEAVELLDRALDWSPDSEVLWEALAATYSQLGRGQDAVALLEKGRRELPNSSQIRYSLGLAYAETGDLPASIEVLNEACSINPDFTRAWYNLGLAYHQTGQQEAALGALRKALELEPRNPDYPYTLATVCRDLGRVDDAIHFLQETLQIQPNHPQATRLMGMLTGGSLQ